MIGITFGELHSYDDLNLILSEKEIGAPSVKKKLIEIEGADGSLDYTDFFGGPKYGDVTHANHAGRVLFSNGLLIQWGRESITPVANTPTKKDVTFAVAYTDTPVVITTPQTAVPGTVVTGSAAANITATGFDCYVTRTGTTATSIGWLAVGYKAPQ